MRDRKEKTRFLDRRMENTIFDLSLCACDGLSPLPVEEKAIIGVVQRKGLGALWNCFPGKVLTRVLF